MVRVHVICEGQTEETFIKEMLQPLLSYRDIHLYPALIGRPGHKGGNIKYSRMLSDIRNRLNDSTAFCTTFFDFYGLASDFPGKESAMQQNSLAAKRLTLEHAFKNKLQEDLGQDLISKFIPYVQMYEFEGLLFSNAQAIADNLLVETQVVEQMINEFESPEHINNSPHTAPSKRLLSLDHHYDKVILGTLIALDIGIDEIRKKCHGFNDWLNLIEKLA